MTSKMATNSHLHEGQIRGDVTRVPPGQLAVRADVHLRPRQQPEPTEVTTGTSETGTTSNTSPRDDSYGATMTAPPGITLLGPNATTPRIVHASDSLATQNEGPRTLSMSPTSPEPSLTISLPSKNEKLLPQAEEASQAPSIWVIASKWLVIAITFLMFLACIMFSKMAIVHMTSTMRLTEKSVDKHCSVFLMLIIVIMIPYGLTFIRSIWCGGLRHDRPWPSKKALAWGIVASISESVGITLFTLEVLPLSPSYIGILLMNGVFFVPIILQIIFSVRRHRHGIKSEKRFATIVLVVACLFSVVGLVLTAMFEIWNNDFPNKKLWEIPVSIILLSFSWCPLVQKLQLNPSESSLVKLIEKSATTKYSAEVERLREESEMQAGSSSTSTLSSVASRASMTSRASNGTTWNREDDFNASLIKNKEKDPHELPIYWAHPQFSARWKISVITSLLKLLLIPSFGILFGHFLDSVPVQELYAGFILIDVNNEAFICFMLSIFASFGGYLFGWGACVMGIHRAAFTAPLLLGTPLTVGAILIKETCQLIFQHGPDDKMCTNNFNHAITIPAAFCLYVSQVLSVGYFLFQTVNIIMPKESQIFWLPGYSGVFLEQHLLLSRKNKQTDASYFDPRRRALKARVFICTTMFREAAHEMEQLLKSYARVNIAKQECNRNFEAHVFLDNGVRGTRLTPFALQLVSLIKKTLELAVEDCTKVTTPYGMKLSWMMHSTSLDTHGMVLTVHLKDNRKVKNKKRWSQIMYMSYIMDYRIREDEKATDEDSFILTTDADIKFSPDSVEALLDLMMRDESVGAVCSRTYPMGSGPVYWYQIFDYAIGHWLQKVANHVLGSVLCCPGCFSVYRVKALRDIVSTYATSVTQAGEFLTKDMGEDRWLCTLMVQSGWRLEYCAAADNSTYCPEEFDEYFKQRRRWIPSSLANQILLLQEWSTIYHFNKQIPLFFIVYQGILLMSALLNPSMLYIIIIGGLQYGVGVPQVIGAVGLLLITVGFTWICLTFSQDFQLKVAKFLTIFFALIMAAVWIGIVVQIVLELAGPHTADVTTASPTARPTPPTKPRNVTKPHIAKMLDNMEGQIDQMVLQMNQDADTLTSIGATDTTDPSTQRYDHPHRIAPWLADAYKGHTSPSPAGPTTAVPHTTFHFPVTPVYLGLMIAVFFITALLHINESYCLLHGIWYILCLPSGSLVLVIYSICNITDRSWGTREEKTKKAFSSETDWKQIVMKAFRKLCFCCMKDVVAPDERGSAPNPGEETQVKQTPDRSDKVEDPQPKSLEKDTLSPSSNISGPDKDLAGAENTKFRKFSRSNLERKSSFKFHADEAENRPVSVIEWLPSNLRRLYSSLFVNNGFEDTSFIAGISQADLEAIGISSIPHINAIMFDIKQLPELDIEPSVPEIVDDWLETIGLQIYSVNFRRSHIVTRTHLEVLRSMTKTDIINELGITKLGHLRRLKIAIENLRYPTAAERETNEVKCQIDCVMTHALSEIGVREHEFWEHLRQTCLLPESVAFAHDLDLKEKLTELRNSCLLAFGVSNAIFLIVMLTLFTKTELNVNGSNVVGMFTAALFGLVLIVQFLAMIVHRISTWMHLIARAPIKRGDPYNATWAWNQTKIASIHRSVESDGNTSGDAADEIAENERQQTVEAARQTIRNRRLLRSRLGRIDEDGTGDTARLIEPV